MCMIAKINWDIFSKLKETLTINHEEIYYQNPGQKLRILKRTQSIKKIFTGKYLFEIII